MAKTIREVKGKARLDLLSPIAAAEQAKAADHGNQKPGRWPWNWRTATVKASDQLGAALRHIAKLQAREDLDPKSLAHHAGHVMQRMAIFIEAQAFGTLIDDRPPALPKRRKRK